MTPNPEIHRRRSLRLQEYDYSRSGAYFITMCAFNRECLFGNIDGAAAEINDCGRILAEIWQDVPKRYPGVELDEFVVMPNHVHGVIFITEPVGAIPVGAIHELPLQNTPLQNTPLRETSLHTNKQTRMIQRRNMLLPKIIGYFKMNTAKRINQQRNTSGAAVWQKNYYEHVIRNGDALNRIREYIVNNPLQWALDRENPNNVGAISVGAIHELPLHESSRQKDEPWRI